MAAEYRVSLVDAGTVATVPSTAGDDGRWNGDGLGMLPSAARLQTSRLTMTPSDLRSTLMTFVGAGGGGQQSAETVELILKVGFSIDGHFSK